MDWRARIPEKYRQQVDQVLRWARSQLESGKPVPARFFIGNSSGGEAFAVDIETSSPASRQAAVHQARLLAAIHQADFVLSAIEAWALAPQDVGRHQEILQRYGSLAEYPGHLDVLSVQLETHEGLFSLQAVIRPKPPSKKKRTIDEPVLLGPEAEAARLANILPVREKPAPHSES